MLNSTSNTYQMKREILNFSANISRKLSKPEKKFSADMTYGIPASGSCHVTGACVEVTTMDNVKIGKFIAECRREKSLTQQQLADMLNLSNKTISKWESGAGSPDISNLAEVAKVLGITVDELLSGERKTEQTEEAASEKAPVKMKLSTAQIITLTLTLLGAAIGGILGIWAYNHGWLG